MTFKERQTLLNKLIIKASKQFEKLNKNQYANALKELDRNRLELIELLEKYTDTNNKIMIQRLYALLNEIQRLTNQYRSQLQKDLEKQIQTSISTSVQQHVKALSDVSNVTPNMFSSINDNVFNYIINRFGVDGLVLSDRIWKVSNDQYQQIEAILRSGIIQGVGVKRMVSEIRKIYHIERWKVKRLVVTETNTAYRTASAYVAQQSNVVRGLRIHRGRADEPAHRCSELEGIDRYGLGKGVYIPNDPEVLNPHPNCTSFVTYELTEV